VATNNHCGLALYACVGDEQTHVHKEQSIGVHHIGKCGKGIVDFGHQCEMAIIGI
jgi:hypothetical protein